MKRYSFQGWGHLETAAGEYVRYTDHAEAIATRDQRIAELERELKTARDGFGYAETERKKLMGSICTDTERDARGCRICETRHGEALYVIFDGPPSHESGRIVEVETEAGKGVRVEWHERPDGLWALGPFRLSELSADSAAR